MFPIKKHMTNCNNDLRQTSEPLFASEKPDGDIGSSHMWDTF